MEIEQEVIRSLLRETLDRLQFKNPSYSLRSFSNRLKTSPATVSAILRGKRRLSLRQVERILSYLPVDSARKESALFLFKSKTPLLAGRGDGSHLPYRVLTPAETRRLFIYPNAAVLALSETVDFESSPDFISKRLNLSTARAKRALSDLCKDGFLQINSRGVLKPTGGAFMVPDDLREEIAFGEFRRSSAKNRIFRPSRKGQAARQVFVTTIFALDPAQLKLMRKMIRDYIVRVAMLGGSGAQKEVYQLSAQLLPVTEEKK